MSKGVTSNLIVTPFKREGTANSASETPGLLLMKGLYSKFHMGLLALGLGVAAVYLWNGMSVAWSEVAIDLPQSNADVLSVFPAVHESERKLRYVCDDEADSLTRSACIDRVVFGNRELSIYNSGGVAGCGFEGVKAGPKECDASYKEARAFVWKQWTERQPGYIAVKRSSLKSGLEWTTHLFIEADSDGKWRVVERTIPMLVPEDAGELQLGDLIEVDWEKSTDFEERRGGPKSGTKVLRLTDLVGNSLIL